MKKHEELFQKEYDRARDSLDSDDMDVALYGFVGGLKALILHSKDGKVSANEMIRVFKDSVDYVIERSENRKVKEL